MRLLALVAFWTAAASAALAQSTPSATPQQIESARAEADRIAAAGNASDLFENVTDDASPRLRHTRSGLVCNFEAGARNNGVRVYPSFARGEDVSCTTEVQAFTITLYATRFPTPTTVEDQLRGATAMIGRSFPGARPFAGGGVNLSGGDGDVSPHQAARFTAQANGRDVFTRVSVAESGGWILKERTTGPGESALQGDLLAELWMRSALRRMAEAPGEPAGSDASK